VVTTIAVRGQWGIGNGWVLRSHHQ
jgi:hypothetical protein